MDTIDTIAKVVTATCAVFAVFTARSGLKTWRRQLYGTAEYDKARRLYRTVLEIRDQIVSFRVPIILSGETEAAFVTAGIVPQHELFKPDPRGTQLVYEQRWNRVQRAYSDFLVELLDAEVLWGVKVREPEHSISSCVASLRSALDEQALESFFSGPRSQETSVALEGVGKVLRRRQTGDAFAAEVAAFVSTYEGILRPHLRRK